MKQSTKNILILLIILAGGLAFVLASEYLFDDSLSVCTEEAKMCPDGSVVSRTGPNCEFAPCPTLNPNEPNESPELTYEAFQQALEDTVRQEIGQPIEGYEPQMFLAVFPGLQPGDFDGVDAQIGNYLYLEGELEHEYEADTLLHSAAPAITDEGFQRLFENVTSRLGYDVSGAASVDEMLNELQTEEITDPDLNEGEPVACTMDAKMCPDGSFVGRVAPDCEFAACPSESSSSEVTTCTPESREVDACIEIYQPVCGLTRVECITEPCDPIPETYSNSCFACMNDRVISYTEGAC